MFTETNRLPAASLTTLKMLNIANVVQISSVDSRMTNGRKEERDTRGDVPERVRARGGMAVASWALPSLCPRCHLKRDWLLVPGTSG